MVVVLTICRSARTGNREPGCSRSTTDQHCPVSNLKQAAWDAHAATHGWRGVNPSQRHKGLRRRWQNVRSYFTCVSLVGFNTASYSTPHAFFISAQLILVTRCRVIDINRRYAGLSSAPCPKSARDWPRRLQSWSLMSITWGSDCFI